MVVKCWPSDGWTKLIVLCMMKLAQPLWLRMSKILMRSLTSRGHLRLFIMYLITSKSWFDMIITGIPKLSRISSHRWVGKFYRPFTRMRRMSSVWASTVFLSVFFLPMAVVSCSFLSYSKHGAVASSGCPISQVCAVSKVVQRYKNFENVYYLCFHVVPLQ